MEQKHTVKTTTAFEFRLAEKLQESRHFIEQVANSTPDILYVLDIGKSKIIYANRKLYDLLGHDHNLFDVHPEDIEQRNRQLRRCRQMCDSDTSEVIVRLRAAGGEWRWFRIRDTVFRRGTDGRPVQLIGNAQDIHAEREIEESLRQSRYFNDQIIAAIPGMLYVLNIAEKRITYISDQVKELMGHDARHVYTYGFPLFREQLHPDDYEARMAHIDACRYLSGEEDKILEFRMKAADGQYRWFRVRDKAFRRDKAGMVIETIGIVTEIQKEKSGQNFQLTQRINKLSPDIIDVYDLTTGRYVYTNRDIAHELGIHLPYPSSPSLRYAMMHPDDVEKADQFLRSIKKAADNETVECTCRMKHASGEYHWYQARGVVFARNEKGEVTRFMRICREINPGESVAAVIQRPGRRESSRRFQLFGKRRRKWLPTSLINLLP